MTPERLKELSTEELERELGDRIRLREEISEAIDKTKAALDALRGRKQSITPAIRDIRREIRARSAENDG